MISVDEMKPIERAMAIAAGKPFDRVPFTPFLGDTGAYLIGATISKYHHLIANLTGPVSLATSLIEPMTLYKAMGKQPVLVHAFMRFLTENLTRFARLMLQAGADILTISEFRYGSDVLSRIHYAGAACWIWRQH